MDTLWKIAARNVIRHKRRTAITGVVMAVGIGLFIMMDSMLVGMDRLTIDNMVAYTESYVKLRTPEYVNNLAGTPLEYGIPEPEGAIQALLASDPSIVAATPRTRFVARLSNYRDEIPVFATALDPTRDGRVFATATSIKEGSWLEGAGAKSVVLGAELATELGLKLGDFVLVSASTVFENINADEYKIVGLAETPMPEINRAGLFMSYADASALLGFDYLVTEIDAASTRHPSLSALIEASSLAASRAESALPTLRADSIGELAQDYLAMRAMKGKFSYIMIMIVLLIAGVGIVNTILMSVYARIREIGVLRAYGMSPKDIKRLFTREGIIIGALGSLAGVLVGGGLVWYLTSTGIAMGALVGDVDMGGLPLTGTLYGEWNFGTMAAGFLFGLFVAFIAARIPARKASALEVVDALKFV